MLDFQLGFIGVGNMATAMLSGAIKSGGLSPADVSLYDIDAETLEKFTALGCTALTSALTLVQKTKLVVLSVKPQQFPEVLPAVKKGMGAETVLISIAAGITIEHIQREMGFACKVVVAMPNTPLLVGEGTTVLAKSDAVTADEFALAKSLFESAGIVQELPASKISESIPIHASSPAFLFEFARNIIQSAVNRGFTSEQATTLVAQTLIGSGKMLESSGKSPQELIDMVASPGGTTRAGLNALEQSNFAQAIENAFYATIWRAKELAGQVSPPAHRAGVTVEVISLGCEDYQKSLELRRVVMREPLGITTTPEDLALDQIATHICAKLDEQVVGTCQLVEKEPWLVKVGQVSVDVSLQKSGIGALLLWKAYEVSKERGYRKLFLHSRVSAKEFYLRQGYIASGSCLTSTGLRMCICFVPSSSKPVFGESLYKV